MNASISVVYYTSKTLKNGNHPLMLRIAKGGKIVFPKVCKSQFYYFCNGNFKNDKLWNLHMNKSRK